uniref:Uncharacterized protein n=1 Tax=Parastrongyloides trichosuri TaxID=131310 RepID=A0A0N4ZUP9_PARTI
MFSIKNFFILLSLISAYILITEAQEKKVCEANQIFNGQDCMCAPGYFSSKSDESKSRCEDECEDTFKSIFVQGVCVKGIFSRIDRNKQPECNLRCGMNFHWWTTVGLLTIAAASIATLIFTIPMCIATCSSCLHARKANKNAKRVYEETTNPQPNKDQSAVATMGYNPYSYWPYYAPRA